MPKEDDEVWVPVTLHLPLGYAKSFSPSSCTPTALLVGPFSIILLAQTANTVLVPVLPFMVKDVGATAVAYGMLQSAMWTSQTFLSPVHGWISDRVGRKLVIVITLLISSGGNALLAMSHSVQVMFVARVFSGLGFQIALFRAHFADTAPKEKRAGSFGLIGVVQSFSLFAGPTIGGYVSHLAGQRAVAWLTAALCLAAALLTAAWQPEEKRQASLQRESSTANLSDKELVEHHKTHKVVNGVKMVKLSVSDGDGGDAQSKNKSEELLCPSIPVRCPALRKTWTLARWLAGYDLYPLLSLNFFFRFAFAAYKSIFAFYCMTQLHFGARR